MKKEELENLIEKCRELSSKFYPRNEEKGALYDRIAEQLEDNINDYVDDDYFTTEDEVIDDIKNSFIESDNFFTEEDYENMDMLDE
jgi:hypothetical protein